MPAFAIVAALGALALAERGEVGKLAVSLFVAGALTAGLAVSLVYTSQFVPYVLGRQSTAQFLSRKSSDYDGIAWVNRHVPNGVVLTDISGTLYLRLPYVVATADNLPPATTPPRLLRFIRCRRISFVALVRGDMLALRLRPILGQIVGRVTVHSVTSRTLNRLGPPSTLIVYRVTSTPAPPGPC
jgi:hypothetical protein